MKPKLSQLTIFLFLGSFALPLMSQEKSLQELERQCEEAREKLIAPLRQEAIEQCIESRQSSRSRQDPREHCENFYRDFGEAGRTQTGHFRQRMFHDIPECQAFYEAERRQGR